MSTQLERLNRLFEFLVRVQEFWDQPWSRLDQLPWSAALQTSSEGAPPRVAPSAPLFPAIAEVFDLVAHEDFRMALALEWLEGPGVDCPFSYQDVQMERIEADIEMVPFGPVRRRTELLRHLGLDDPPGEPFRLRPCQVLFVQPMVLDYTLFFSRLKKAIQEVDDLPASLAYFSGPSPAKPEPTYRQSLWALPISPEQEEVVHRLAVRPLVVVEGGPGTGKSHLAANLLGHCLALGQRVLVTGPTAGSLRSVLEHLPAELHDLCTGPDQSPKAQLKRLLKRLETVDSKNLLKEAEKLKKRREDLNDEMARLEQELQDRVMREYSEYHGVRVGDLGRRLAAERAEHGWIPGPVGARAMPLSLEEVAELYDTNRLTPEEEAALAVPLPERAELLTPEELASLGEMWKIVETYPDGNLWAGTPPPETLDALPEAAEAVTRSLGDAEPWFLECIWRTRTNEKHRQTYATLLRELEQNKKLRARMQEQIGDREPTLAYADDEAQEVCQELLDHVSRGGTVTGIAATFLKPRWKKFLRGVKVKGQPPTTEADFRTLLDGIALRRLEAGEDHRWAQEMILLGLMGAEQKAMNRADVLRRALNWGRDVFSDFEHKAAASGLLWERALEQPSESDGGSGRALRRLLTFLDHELEELLERRRQYLEVCQLMKRADQEARYLKTGARSSPNPVWGQLRQTLVERNVGAYRQALDLLLRWEQLTPLSARRRELLERLERGAPAWADALAGRQSPHDGRLPPGDVARAWEHRQAAQWIRSRYEEEGSEKLHAQLAETRAELEKVTRELVLKRAWAVQHMRIGKREQSPEDGLPVWVVPLEEVVGRFCPDETRFDLLIIEHAAEVDLRATGLLALGQRALVMGDPERMAAEPTSEPRELASLASPFLAEHPRARTGSLLSWLDQGDSLRLTQPFRSRPEMLHLLRALESSVAAIPGHPPRYAQPAVVSHRLRLEAGDISALVCAILRETRGQSVGVVCTDPLLARKVRRVMRLAVPPGAAPRIGGPTALQGEERDIALVVMPDGDRYVVSPADRSRLLTALGVAREQVWLLFSSDVQALSAGDLRSELIQEADGMSQLALAPEGSSWRGMVAQALKKAGYRAHPFDERTLRVQGHLGWVLVTMYGEASVPPTRADLARESWLEQHLGWRFLRLRSSRFWHDPESILAELVEVLGRLGLEPLEGQLSEPSVLRILKTAQDLRHDMPPTPKTAVSLVSSYRPGDFNWVWQPLVRRLLLEGVAVAPVGAEGYAIEVERNNRRLLVANRKFEDIDLVVDLARLEASLSEVLEALGPAAPPLPRPPLVTSVAPGWEGPLVQAPVAETEAFWDEPLPAAAFEPSEEPLEAEEVESAGPSLAEPGLGWETTSWMDSREEMPVEAMMADPVVPDPQPAPTVAAPEEEEEIFGARAPEPDTVRPGTLSARPELEPAAAGEIPDEASPPAPAGQARQKPATPTSEARPAPTTAGQARPRAAAPAREAVGAEMTAGEARRKTGETTVGDRSASAAGEAPSPGADRSRAAATAGEAPPPPDAARSKAAASAGEAPPAPELAPGEATAGEAPPVPEMGPGEATAGEAPPPPDAAPGEATAGEAASLPDAARSEAAATAGEAASLPDAARSEAAGSAGEALSQPETTAGESRSEAAAGAGAGAGRPRPETAGVVRSKTAATAGEALSPPETTAGESRSKAAAGAGAGRPRPETAGVARSKSAATAGEALSPPETTAGEARLEVAPTTGAGRPGPATAGEAAPRPTTPAGQARPKPAPPAGPARPKPETRSTPESQPAARPPRAAAPASKAGKAQPAAFFQSGRFEFGAASPVARPQRPAGEPSRRGDSPQPSPPPPRASSSVRPPQRPGPPKTAFGRKPEPAQPRVAPARVEDIRALMLQAFELIQPISNEALGELVEGVSSVGLEKGGRDHRRAPRLLCCYDVLCEAGGESFRAVVSEVSLTGVRLELASRLSRDTLVVLRPEMAGELEPVRCQVRWCRRNPEGLAAGLAFHEDPEQLSRSWVAALLHSLGFGPEHTHQRRKSLRVPTPRLRVQLEGPRGKALGVALDMGVGGMLFETAARLTLQDRIQLTLGPHEGLPTITVQARVANRRDRKVPAYGVAFQDLTPAVMKGLGSYVLTFLAARARGKRS